MTILEMANQLGHMLAETDVMKRSKLRRLPFSRMPIFRRI